MNAVSSRKQVQSIAMSYSMLGKDSTTRLGQIGLWENPDRNLDRSLAIHLLEAELGASPAWRNDPLPCLSSADDPLDDGRWDRHP